MTTRVAIALGSNLGDRRSHLDFAVAQLRSTLHDLVCSQYHETAPVDVPVVSADFAFVDSGFVAVLAVAVAVEPAKKPVIVAVKVTIRTACLIVWWRFLIAAFFLTQLM